MENTKKHSRKQTGLSMMKFAKAEVLIRVRLRKKPVKNKELQPALFISIKRSYGAQTLVTVEAV